MRKIRNFIDFIIWIFVIFLLSQCVQKRAVELAPSELLGMKKQLLLSGEKAIEAVKKSHIGKLKDIKDLAIFRYTQGNKSIILWITTYPTSKVAKTETERMVQAMLKFKGWENLKKLKIDKKIIYYISKGNKMHYFWNDSYCVFYIVSENLNKKEKVAVIKSLNCN